MQDKNTSKKYELFQPLLLSLMVVLGIFLGKKIEQSSIPETKLKNKSIPGAKNYTGLLEEAARFVDARYIDSIHINTISELAIGSMVRELDPFSVYIPSDRPIIDTLTSFIEAYGFNSILLNNNWYIRDILPSSLPALRALDIGDRIISVQEKTPNQGTFEKWPDKSLKLTLIKSGSTIPIAVELSRNDSSEIHTVLPAFPLNDQVGYIRILHFGDNTYDEFITALDSLHSKYKIKHLIVDLRDNSGGYVEECSRIMNQFFKEKNILLVTTQGRTVRKAEYKTDGRQLFNLDKIAIIINKNSASASEIFAGVMQDLDRGLVVGTPSYGKGLVQEQYMLSNGGALRLSVARFILPSGRSVDLSGKNILPEKVYSSVKGRKIPASRFIIPDILIASDTTAEIQELSMLKERITSEIFQLKISGLQKAYNPKESPIIEKIVWNALKLQSKNYSAYKSNIIKKHISRSWMLANEDFTRQHRSVLSDEPTIRAALKAIQ